MSDWDLFWQPLSPHDPAAPGVAEDEIREWEQEFGVRLPATLAKALTVQNGGRVRAAGLVLNPLWEISPLSDEQWDDHFRFGDQGVADRGQLFSIGDSVGVGVILDYRAGSEPTILLMIHNVGGELRDHGIGTFDDLLQLVRSQPIGI